LENRICHAGAIEEVYSIIFEEEFGPTPLQQDCTLDAGLQSWRQIVWEPNARGYITKL
jgi:hypothetical protein